jgi:hypothetical protein
MNIRAALVVMADEVVSARGECQSAGAELMRIRGLVVCVICDGNSWSRFRLVARLSIIKGILIAMSPTRAGGARRLGVKIGHYDKPLDLTA